MGRSRRIALLVLVVAVLVVPGAVAPASAADGELEVTFLDVGQGDAALYRGPCGEVGLVDAGDGARDAVLGALDARGSRALQWISPSHYDADHLGDVVDVGSAAGASVTGLIPGDQSYTTGLSDTAGVRLVEAAGRVVDQVGPTAANGCTEATPAPAKTGVPARDDPFAAGRAADSTDTGDNGADFALQSATPTNAAGLDLGAALLPVPPDPTYPTSSEKENAE